MSAPEEVTSHLPQRKVKIAQLYPQYETICWQLLAGIQILPIFVSVPLGVQLIVNSTVVVALGALKSVEIEASSDGDTAQSRYDSEHASGEAETIKTKDALMFPITASASLLVLYLLFSYVNKDLIKGLLKIYFSYLGMYVLGLFFAEKFLERDSTLEEISYEKQTNFKIPYLMEEPLKISMRKADNYGFAISFVLATLYCLTSHWLLNNIFGVTFAIGAIRLIKISEIKIGLIMLWGLFLYDIFWVFKTDVMVTVAKSVDGPILLKFPINIAENKFSMLGLGDMIVPGAFISLLLKFDVDSYLKAFPQCKIENIRAPFFWYNLIFYLVGIVVTYVFMQWFNHAQPALLYLVPAASIGFLIPALQRGGLQEIFEYKIAEAEPLKENKQE